MHRFTIVACGGESFMDRGDGDLWSDVERKWALQTVGFGVLCFWGCCVWKMVLFGRKILVTSYGVSRFVGDFCLMWASSFW